MKRRITIVMLLITLSLTACRTTANKLDTATIEFANFGQIPGKDYLVYDLDTKIVYYLFSTNGPTDYQGYGYCTEYLGEGGHPCRYIDGEIIENGKIIESTE